MKRQLFLFLVNLLPLMANAYDLSDNKGLYYNIKGDGTLEVVGLSSKTKTADILSDVTINGRTYRVTSIGAYAFEGRSDITYLSIPWSIASIGEYAFIDCGSSITVNIADPESWCQMKLGNEHSSPLSSAGKVLVHDIETTNISIPAGVTSIGSFTFYQCRSIRSLTIPSSVTTIGSSAFEDCTGLTSLTLSEGLQSIGGSAFQGCTGLKALTIPSTVNTIYINAFANCKGITDVYCYAGNVPNTDSDAFDATPTEKSTLHVPANAIQKYRSTWPWSDFKLIVSLDNNTSLIDNGIIFAVKGDGTLEVVGLESGKRTADILSDVTINGRTYRVTSIGAHAFEGRSDITYLSIPWSVKSIGEYAFIDCGSSITVNIADPESWCQMKLGNEHSSPLSSAGKVLVHDIETTNIIIPAGVTSIGSYTFYQCRCIWSLTIPNSVTSIGRSAFEDCSNLNTITSEIQNPFAIDRSVFSTYATATLNVPKGTKSAYQSTAGWKNFANIVEPSGGEEKKIVLTALNYSREYGEVNPTFDYMKEGGDLNGTPTITCDATRTSSVGTYPIRISRGSVTNKDVTYVDGTLTITKAPLVITAKSYSREQGQANPTFEVTYSGFKNNETASVLTRQPIVSSAATVNSAAGSYDIIVSGAEAQNYNITYNKGVLIVTEKDEAAMTIDGITYKGSKLTKSVVVMYVDKSMACLIIPASVSFDGVVYQVTGISDNAFDGSNMAALVWNVEAALPNNAFSNASIGSNFVLYVKSATYAPSTVKNVVVDGTAQTVVLSDNGGQFYCPQTFIARTISYTHNYSMETGKGQSKGWETIALPFDVQKVSHSSKGEIVPFALFNSGSSKKPFWLAYFSGSGFKRTDAIKANEPYIIAMPNNSSYQNEYNLNGDVTFSAENVQVIKTPTFSGTFIPTFATVAMSSNVKALNVNNRYVKYSGNEEAGSHFISGLREVRPFEAYMTGSSSRSVEINFDDETTEIDDILLPVDEGRDTAIYNMSGQQVARITLCDFDRVWNCLPKGVYIVNGKKRIK